MNNFIFELGNMTLGLIIIVSIVYIYLKVNREIQLQKLSDKYDNLMEKETNEEKKSELFRQFSREFDFLKNKPLF